ncbi:MAG TPA: energy transducer TonB [Arenimonas sp.]|uniref:energy transducer TonB n=1 Tax=Arenimonas sp. TaxID=1872635 RepID=UPI002D804FF8|nr:energy transducer TonB [Arenimonas sp.]HEU0152661.1 energy transducer TonB [Arenimonas sp.]
MLWLALAAAPTPETCPPPAMPLPRYSMELMRRGKPGTTKVLARFDDCGRIVEASVATASGQSELDEAALAAVRTWVLSPAQRASIEGEWVRLPVTFGGVRRIDPIKAEWAKSHRRPDYLADQQPLGFDSIEAFHAARLVRADPVYQAPFASRRRDDGLTLYPRFERHATDDDIYWLTWFASTPRVRSNGAIVKRGQSTQVAVVRYRLAEEAGEPVVRVALHCEDTPANCDELRELAFKGLPSARPRRR